MREQQMQGVPISWARSIGQRLGYRRVAILYSDGKTYGITTYGATREECRALAKWAEGDDGADAGSTLTLAEYDAKFAAMLEKRSKP